MKEESTMQVRDQVDRIFESGAALLGMVLGGLLLWNSDASTTKQDFFFRLILGGLFAIGGAIYLFWPRHHWDQ
jgi:ABC-type Mn2+/Zn2+ transport system permease subunit